MQDLLPIIIPLVLGIALLAWGFSGLIERGNHTITLTCEDGRDGRTTPVMEPHYVNGDMWHEDSYVVVRCLRG